MYLSLIDFKKRVEFSLCRQHASEDDVRAFCRDSAEVGATVADIRLMRQVLSPAVKIKASGGIYALDFTLELIRAGADQLGMSRGEQIIREFHEPYGDGLELGS